MEEKEEKAHVCIVLDILVAEWEPFNFIIDDESGSDNAQEIKTDFKVWASSQIDDLKSKSHTPVYTSFGDSRANLSGTIIRGPRLSWRLARLICSDHLVGIYSSTPMATSNDAGSALRLRKPSPPAWYELFFNLLRHDWEIRVYSLKNILKEARGS